jgi:hypothetical protein
MGLMPIANRTWLVLPLLAALIRTVGTPEAYSIPPDLPRAVPADVAAVYFWQGGLANDGDGGSRSGDLAARLAGGAQQVGLLGLLDPALRPWADTAAGLIVAGPHPFAIAVLEARAAPRQDEVSDVAAEGHQLSDLRAALILMTHKQNAAIERQIQHFLLTYTNKAYTTLTTDGGSPPSRFALRDSRLPAWCEVNWGPIGDYYVVSVGQGSFERVLETLAQSRSALARNEWFSTASDALDLSNAAVGLYLRPGTIIAELDAVLYQKVARVRSALHLAATDRGLWTLHTKDRAIEVNMFRSVATTGAQAGTPDSSRKPESGSRYQNEQRTLASGRLPDGAPLDLVPRGARRYTVIEWNAPAALDALSRAYLMSRSPSSQAKLRLFWGGVERDSGLSIRDDVISHFGPYLLIHNDPAHALRLPLAWTYVIPIDGSDTALRANIDKLLGYARERLGDSSTLRLRRDDLRTLGATPTPGGQPDKPAEQANGLETEPSEHSRPTDRRSDADSESQVPPSDAESISLWYLFAGLNGPALAVTDQYLVISYSPHALRLSLSHLEAVKGNDSSKNLAEPLPSRP